MKSAIIEAAEELEEAVATFDKVFKGARTEKVSRLAALAQRLRAEASGWQPIETAPKDGRFVDLWNGGRVTDARWCTPDGHCEDHKAWCFLEAEEAVEGRGIRWNWWELDRVPTHWMPLPAPPQS